MIAKHESALLSAILDCKTFSFSIHAVRTETRSARLKPWGADIDPGKHSGSPELEVAKRIDGMRRERKEASKYFSRSFLLERVVSQDQVSEQVEEGIR